MLKDSMSTIVFLLISLQLSFAQGSTDSLTAKDEFDFRKTRWGMTKNEVKKTESAKEVSEIAKDNIIGYESEVGGLKCLIAYIFVDDLLVRAKYMFIQEHSNKNSYINDYDEMNETLKQKYGVPKETKKTWLNDLYRDDYDSWGFAISLGHLAYYSVYETESTTITILLQGENYDISHGVEYKSRQFGDIETQKKKQKESKDF